MCYDPWELDINRFAYLYLESVHESEDLARPEWHRRIWAGKAEAFAEGYAEKLSEREQKRRANGGVLT